MTQIMVNDELIGKVMAVGHYHDPKEAVVTILTDYLKQHQTETTPFDSLRLSADYADDDLAQLFERNSDVGRDIAL
ncbi:MAG: type II toxin-antitoxin system VapB family antitoxin [Sulfuriferula sp.]|nr:type II toxin-antitoxin system VapB family antitoxin [Sulfuriferula sp.]